MKKIFLKILVFAFGGFLIFNVFFIKPIFAFDSIIQGDCDPTKAVEVETKDPSTGQIIRQLEYPKECGWGHLIDTIQNLIKIVVVELAPALAMIFILWGSFLMMFGGASSSNIGKGKEIIYTALIGYILILISGFIVDLVLGFLSGGDPSQIQFGK